MGRTVLLVMDYQNNVVARFGTPDALSAAVRAVDAARAAGVTVMFPRVDFRPGFPEIAPTNLMYGGVPARSKGMPQDPRGTAIHDSLAPRDDEPIVTKKRVSAFVGSDLDVLLRSAGATHLVLAGIATSGVVLSTLRTAADLDYELTVLSDACADGDPEVHGVLMQKVFPQQARVLEVDDWVGTLVRT
jgi:nicotinamidase-related amidase